METGATEEGFAANAALRKDQKGKSSAWVALKVEEVTQDLEDGSQINRTAKAAASREEETLGVAEDVRDGLGKHRALRRSGTQRTRIRNRASHANTAADIIRV